MLQAYALRIRACGISGFREPLTNPLFLLIQNDFLVPEAPNDPLLYIAPICCPGIRAVQKPSYRLGTNTTWGQHGPGVSFITLLFLKIESPWKVGVEVSKDYKKIDRVAFGIVQ